MSATVTLDREAVVDLLIEAYAVSVVLERIAGVEPTALTEELGKKLEWMSMDILGKPSDGPNGEMVGPAVDLWMIEAPRRADELARELSHAS